MVGEQGRRPIQQQDMDMERVTSDRPANVFELAEFVSDETLGMKLGKAFLDASPEEVRRELLDSLTELTEHTHFYNGNPIDPEFRVVAFKNATPELEQIVVGRLGLVDFRAHSFVTGREYCPFYDRRRHELSFYRPSHKGWTDDNAHIDVECLKAINGRVPVPSGKLVFANYFVREKSDIHVSINTYEGRYKLTKLMNDAGYGYGQTTNSSFTIFENGREIILYQGNVDNCEEDQTHFRQWLNSHGFSRVDGCISMDVWRWECADSELAKVPDGGESVILPIDGNSVSYTHYHNTIESSPVHPEIIAHLKIEKV